MLVDAQELLTVREAAERFGVSVGTVRNWMRQRRIAAYRRQINRRVYVDALEIERMLRIEEVPHAE